jgi:hypothetical protein
MKKFAFVFAFLTFCGLSYGQDVDSMNVAAAADSMTAVNDAAAMEQAEQDAYVAASEAALANRLEAKATAAQTVTDYEDLRWTWRMWVAIILVLGGVISGAIGYAGYVNYEATALPEIHHVYPNPVKGGDTNIDLGIPANVFMAAVKVRDRAGTEYFSQEIDNSAGKIKVDFSDVPVGKYKLTLEGELGSSPVTELVIAESNAKAITA